MEWKAGLNQKETGVNYCSFKFSIIEITFIFAFYRQIAHARARLDVANRLF